MRLITLLIASVVVAAPAFAQQSQSGSGASQYSAATGTQIKGNVEINAEQENASAVASADGASARNSVGTIRGDTQIQGDTRISARQRNATAVASGRGSSAANEVGVIGGGR
jgi:hypothetical protein